MWNRARSQHRITFPRTSRELKGARLRSSSRSGREVLTEVAPAGAAAPPRFFLHPISLSFTSTCRKGDGSPHLRLCPSRYGRVHRGLLRPRSCVSLVFFLRNYEAGRDNSRLYAPCLSLCSAFTSAGHTANLVSPSTVRKIQPNFVSHENKGWGGVLMLCTAL